MSLSRRHLLQTGLALSGSSLLGMATAAPAPKRILVLGGTGFLGPAIVEVATARGHTLTLFNRGRTRPGLFPNVEERLRSQGTKLSGGEQQMLAIGRILRTGARLLLLDEPTEGLAPVIIEQIGRTIRTLKEQGVTIILVEQNFRLAATVADRYYVMEHGRVVEGFTQPELDANRDKLHDYLGV